MWNKDEVKGKAEQAKGVVKEKAGRAVGDPDLEADGIIDQAKGKVREGVGTVKRNVKEAVNDTVKGAREQLKKDQNR